MSRRRPVNGHDPLSGDLPYEKNSEPADTGEQSVFMTGGVMVTALDAIQLEDGTRYAGLQFQFPHPGGETFTMPIVLAMSADNMRKLRPLITAAIHDACEALKRAEE